MQYLLLTAALQSSLWSTGILLNKIKSEYELGNWVFACQEDFWFVVLVLFPWGCLVWVFFYIYHQIQKRRDISEDLCCLRDVVKLIILYYRIVIACHIIIYHHADFFLTT